MKVLVGILFSGENEFEQCLESLREQTFLTHEKFVLENLPNKIAHDTLYARFMENAKDFDFFLKLDADMVVQNEHSLQDMIYQFSPETGSLLAYVMDCPSAINIPGIQMFRSDAKWQFSDEKLDVDYSAQTKGKVRTIANANVVFHMPNPSNYQLFCYGIHKALKAIQPGRKPKIVEKGFVHMAILNGIARNYFAGKSNLFWPLLGAFLIFSGMLRDVEYRSQETRQIFDDFDAAPQKDKITSDVQYMWRNEIQTMIRWWSAFNAA